MSSVSETAPDEAGAKTVDATFQEKSELPPDVTYSQVEASRVDAAFQEYKRLHPDATYSSWYTTNVAAKVSQGHQHNSLGSNIVKGEISEFWETGRRQATRLVKIGGIKETQRIVEYGCGSLRLGGHFIKMLGPGQYFGLDIIPDFFQIGIKNVGQELVDEKKPRLLQISEKAVAEAAAFAPDFVYSFSVLIHVHPDDLPAYFRNLTKIAKGKPGSKLAFNCMLHPEPVRYNNLGWAWPDDYLVKQLPELECVKVDRSPHVVDKNGYSVTGAMLTFVNSRG